MHDDIADVHRSFRKHGNKRQHRTAMRLYMASAVLLAIMFAAAAFISATR